MLDLAPAPSSTLPEPLVGEAARESLDRVVERLVKGQIVPYLGPGLMADPSPVPTTPETLALALHQRFPAPARVRGNMWSVAQFIEQRRHRKTLVAAMAEIFAAPVAPTALQRELAALGLPLVVDTWYDGAARAALAGADFVEIQGITRALEFGDVWTRAYRPDGGIANDAEIAAAKTILYKPHGAITPAANFLVADSDYVEVLTEIDIQTPIPEIVRQLRGPRGFLFLGCRFHDQMLRTFARQIAKRSAGEHVALVGAEDLTRNELKFYAELGVTVLALPLAELEERLG
jgi:hypothetical protein